MTEFSLADRYGQRPSRWRGPALVFLIVGGSWLVWAGLHHSRPEISTTLISFQSRNDRTIEIRYSVDRRNPDVGITCTLIALDFDKNVVGEIEDLIAPGAGHSERTSVIPTRSQAVNAGISRCRLTSP
ncbi:unannotated protein [freshwater metagenome]|uniref:Unannotated protein n=1 Tax=freshwater metagenome TaxID=449393 RepID=A0A6J6PBB3_9ZZZZ|nr:DUF4307 domain-containing protein [Actinomycetota bacterium]